MPTLKADFSTISTSFDPLPVDTPLKIELKKIEEKKSSGGLDQLVFEHEVVEPAELAGRKLFDFVVLETKEKQPNKVGYGRVKAYTEAMLGAEAGNGGEIDTDALIGNACTVILKNRSYTKDGESKTTQEIAKVLPQ